MRFPRTGVTTSFASALPGSGVGHEDADHRVLIADRARRRDQLDALHGRDLLGQRGHLLRRGLADDLDGRGSRTPGTARPGCRRRAGPARSAAAVGHRSCAAPSAAPARPGCRGSAAPRPPPATAAAASSGPARRRSPPRGRRRRAGRSVSGAPGSWSAPRAGASAAPASASSAGTRVSATSSATTTTLTPAAPTARRILAWNTSSPDRLIATVIPENITVRPAVRIVATSASVRAALVDRVVRHTQMCPQFLPVAGDDQQAVVDAQAQPEHRHDVDHGRVQVDQVGETQQGGESAGDGGDRAEDGHAGGQETRRTPAP